MSFFNNYKKTYALLLLATFSWQKINGMEQVVAVLVSVVQMAPNISQVGTTVSALAPLLGDLCEKCNPSFDKHNLFIFEENQKQEIKAGPFTFLPAFLKGKYLSLDVIEIYQHSYLEHFLWEIKNRTQVLRGNKMQTLINIALLWFTCYSVWELNKNLCKNPASASSTAHFTLTGVGLLYQLLNWHTALTYQNQAKQDLNNQIIESHTNILRLQNQLEQIQNKINIMDERVSIIYNTVVPIHKQWYKDSMQRNKYKSEPLEKKTRSLSAGKEHKTRDSKTGDSLVAEEENKIHKRREKNARRASRQETGNNKTIYTSSNPRSSVDDNNQQTHVNPNVTENLDNNWQSLVASSKRFSFRDDVDPIATLTSQDVSFRDEFDPKATRVTFPPTKNNLNN